MKYQALAVLFLAFFAIVPGLHAQTTGGVFGPLVNEGHRSAQYRIATDADSDRLAQRIHYQQSLNGEFMMRAVLQYRDTSEGSSEFDFVQAEAFWQLSEDSASWVKGLRFDLRARDNNRPAQFGLNFTNQFQLSDRLAARAILLSSAQFGDNAQNGISLASRARLAYRSSPSTSVGWDLFSSYGLSDNLRGIEEQTQLSGPWLNAKFARSWSVNVSALFGLTEASDDLHLRLFLGRAF